MRAQLVLPAVAASLMLLTSCDIEDLNGFERFHEDFHYNYPLKTGARLSVETFNGSVDVSEWDEPTIDISGTKHARSMDDMHDLKIDISHSADSVSIRAIRPSVHRGNWGAQFVIKVPRGVVLSNLVSSNGAIRTNDGIGPARFRTSNGRIDVRRLKGSLTAETSNSAVELLDVDGAAEVHSSNGHIRADGVRGAFEATTSNSSIHATLEKTDGTVRVQSSNGSIDLTMPPNLQSSVRAHTSNSSITLHLPGEVNARLSANTSNSSITTDFEMRLRGEIGKHHIEGSIGNGGPLLDLDTSNGAIRIVR